MKKLTFLLIAAVVFTSPLFSQRKKKRNKKLEPTEEYVFDTKKFDDLISYLKEKYDYIIFDSAPILFMVDSLELLEKSDYVVHVFRKNFSSKKLVNYVLDYKEKYNKKKHRVCDY